jgi:hypothetical protein
MDSGSWQPRGPSQRERPPPTTSNFLEMASILPELIETGNRIEDVRNKASGCCLNASPKGFMLSHGGLGRRTQIASQASDHPPLARTMDGAIPTALFASSKSRTPFSERIRALIAVELRTEFQRRISIDKSTPRPFWSHVAARSHCAGCSPSCCWLLSLVGSLSGNGCVLLLALALRWCRRFGGFLWLTFDQLLH